MQNVNKHTFSVHVGCRGVCTSRLTRPTCSSECILHGGFIVLSRDNCSANPLVPQAGCIKMEKDSTSIFVNLPATAISRICRFLNVHDLLSLAHSCSYARSVVSQDGLLWSRHCKHVWACEELQCANTWFECWLQFCKQYNRYRSCFAQIRIAWRKIEQVIRVCEPGVVISPVSEEELNELEERLAVQLSCDYRCSLRLSGKQAIPLGTVSCVVIERNEKAEVNVKNTCLYGVRGVRLEVINLSSFEPYLTQADQSANFLVIGNNFLTKRTRFGQKQYKQPITGKECFLINATWSTIDSCPKGHVVTAFTTSIRYGIGQPGGCCIHPSSPMFEWHRIPCTSTFADWLSSEADKMQHYYITQQNQLTRFILKPNCEATTELFTVRVADAIFPDTNKFYASVRSCLCIIVKLSENAVSEKFGLKNVHLQLDGEDIECSFLPVSSNKILHAGQVIEYVSSPLEFPTLSRLFSLSTDDPITVLLTGFIAMQNIRSDLCVKIRLPEVILDTYKAKYFH